VELARQILAQLDSYGARDRIAVVIGGIIPPGDVPVLKEMGVERVFTPADYELLDIMESISDVVEERAASYGGALS
jgi:methylmalonyl-CoA mutase cobalamin-binding domain/chain